MRRSSAQDTAPRAPRARLIAIAISIAPATRADSESRTRAGCTVKIPQALKSFTLVASCSFFGIAHEGDPSTGGCDHWRTALEAARPSGGSSAAACPRVAATGQCDAVAALDGDRNALPRWADGLAGAGHNTPTPQAKAANGLCSNERGGGLMMKKW